MDHRQQQEGVRAGPDEHVLVGDGRGLGPAGIDHHHPPPAGLQLLHPAPDIGHGHHRAVRRHRIGAQNEEELRVVDVGDGLPQLMAEQQHVGQLMGQLVQRRRGVAVARTQHRQERHAVRHGAEAVHVRVADVHAHGVAAVGVPDLRQPSRHEVDRLVPLHLDPPVVGPPDGSAQSVRIVRDVDQGRGLRTQVATRERILLVAPDGLDAGRSHRVLESAHRLAQSAGAVRGTRAGGIGRHDSRR